MPVKPSRAQELLYGPTIDDFVCGEQIAKALTMKAKLKPELVLTDCRAVLALSLVSDVLAAVLDFEPTELASSPRFTLPGTKQAVLRSITVEKRKFSVLNDSSLNEDSLGRLLSPLAANFDLTEPFQRITEALLEAHPIARAA
jgi:hypothetical protein